MLKFEKCLVSPDVSLIWRQLQYSIYFIFIFFSANYIKNGVCIIPEASQEGPLRSFKNYGDVVMFHYSIPKQVLRATWQFAAFMNNDNCPQRKVNIFLKWGSYPVISVNNASFPSNMYVDRNHTIQATAVTTFEPKNSVIVPVYSPEPGDWFVGAYLSHWDEKIHQKGLGYDCHYSLGSVAIWSDTNSIENIPLGYQKSVKTTDSISYYKFYIPMDTWSFQIDIWGCNFTMKKILNSNESCIKNVSIKGRTLPLYNHSDSNSTKRLTPMDTFTFLEASPFQETWYYLMVVSKNEIKFNVKITVSYCPVRTIEEIFIRRYIDTPIYSRASDQLYLKNFRESIKHYAIDRAINQSQVKEHLKTVNQQSNNGEDNNLSTCIPRYQLVRIKHAQIFNGDYLLQGKEWLTSWLTLTDAYPVIVQFDILPLVDIGGTLEINLDLEIDGIMTKQQVKIIVCVNRGRIPKQENDLINCENKYMTMQLSNTDANNASLLIPYPQPDTWYITFQTICYVNGMPAHCEMKEILISLNIMLRACVFEGSNSCGQYGICEEIRKGLLFFTACKCFGGRQGWACTDTSNAISEYAALLASLALILSNLFFIPAIYMAFKRNFYTEGLVYASTMLFSALYHACDQQFIEYCVAKFEVLQYCDFFLGILAFWVTLISMANISVQYVSFYYMLGVIIITYVVESDKTGLSSIAVPLIIGCFIPLTSYGYYCIRIKQFMWPERIGNLIIGLILVAIGILLFSLVETESNYQFVHSVWHVLIALSPIFLLPVKEKNIQSNKLNEKPLTIEESQTNSVFNINGRQPNNHLIEDIS